MFYLGLILKLADCNLNLNSKSKLEIRTRNQNSKSKLEIPNAKSKHEIKTRNSKLEIQNIPFLTMFIFRRLSRFSDYAFLWNWSGAKARYYLQLEDDIIAKKDFLDFITSKISRSRQNWFLIEFSNLGFIGKLFRSESLEILTNFVLMFYREKPVDWLLEQYLFTKVCNPDMEPRECKKWKSKIKVILYFVLRNFFRHTGSKLFLCILYIFRCLNLCLFSF